MYEFTYRETDSVPEALAMFKTSEEARYLAGGMTLLPTMKQRLAAPDVLIDLNGIDALKGIEQHNNSIVIGALTTHADVANSDLVKRKLPALAELAATIGDPQVRNRGTIGGSLANADPAADYPAAALGLNAIIQTDNREIAAAEFFTDIFETSLQDNELITCVSFPIPEKAAYRKFPNPASGYAIVGVFVSVTDGQPSVAVTGAAGSVFRAEKMEQALVANFHADVLRDVAIDFDEFNEDIHASAEYRGHLVGVMARRAVDAMQ